MIFNKTILLLCIIQFTVCNVSAQKTATSFKYTILTYGLPDDNRRNASIIIQRKWQIKIYPVTMCIVSDELSDSVENENDKVYKLIEKEYGKEWKKKFDDEVEDEYKIETQIDSLVKKQSYIKNKEIANPLPGSPFPMYPLDIYGNYMVTVSTYNKQWEEQKLYKLKVNYKKNTVVIIRDYSGD